MAVACGISLYMWPDTRTYGLVDTPTYVDGDDDAFLLSGIRELRLMTWWTCLGNILVSESAFHFVSAIVLRTAEFHAKLVLLQGV